MKIPHTSLNFHVLLEWNCLLAHSKTHGKGDRPWNNIQQALFHVGKNRLGITGKRILVEKCHDRLRYGCLNSVCDASVLVLFLYLSLLRWIQWEGIQMEYIITSCQIHLWIDCIIYFGKVVFFIHRSFTTRQPGSKEILKVKYVFFFFYPYIPV